MLRYRVLKLGDKNLRVMKFLVSECYLRVFG